MIATIIARNKHPYQPTANFKPQWINNSPTIIIFFGEAQKDEFEEQARPRAAMRAVRGRTSLLILKFEIKGEVG
jgi:hypothetical protein